MCEGYTPALYSRNRFRGIKLIKKLAALAVLSAVVLMSAGANADVIEHPLKSVYKYRECSVLAMKMNRESLSRDHYLSALAATLEIGMTKVQFKKSWDRVLHNWEFVEANMGAENFQNYVKAVYFPLCK